MGFALADICAILPIYDDSRTARAVSSRRVKAELEQPSGTTLRSSCGFWTAARKRLRKEETMNYNVTIKTLPERYAATVRMTIPRYEDEGMVWTRPLPGDRLHCTCSPADPCYCCVAFLDGEYKEKDVTVEAQKTVKGQLSRHGARSVPHAAAPSPTPAAPSRAAMSRSTTSPPRSPPGSRRTATNTTDRCSTSTTSARTRPSNPDEFVTEVCYPVRKK